MKSIEDGFSIFITGVVMVVFHQEVTIVIAAAYDVRWLW
jgi:hypothetical protein